MVIYRGYWIAWGLLLALTLVMVATESLGLGRGAAIGIVCCAALVKASVIAGWFMHLRLERPGLAATVVIAALATAAVLFILIVPDGLAMGRLAERP